MIVQLPPHDQLAVALLRCPLRNWTPREIESASVDELHAYIQEGMAWWNKRVVKPDATERAIRDTLERVEMMLGVEDD